MTLTPEEIKQIEQEASELYERFHDVVSGRYRMGYIAAATKYLLQLKQERERAGKLLGALEEWKQAHENFDSGYKNIDGKTTRMNIAALSLECNSADRNLLTKFHNYKNNQ